jgi:gamma-glutamyltranspeptidase
LWDGWGCFLSVPGCVHAWQEIYERFAAKSLAYLFAPTIDYAQGFPASHHLVEIIRKYRDILQKDRELQKNFFTPGQRFPSRRYHLPG